MVKLGGQKLRRVQHCIVMISISIRPPEQYLLDLLRKNPINVSRSL